MRVLNFMLLSVLLVSCMPHNSDLQSFNDFLGKEKAESLNKLVNSFEDFIDTNFGGRSSEGEKIKEFFEVLSKEYKPDSSWVFDTKRNKRILKEFENSGMRLEIKRYENEYYNPKEFLASFFEEFEPTDTAQINPDVNFEDPMEIPVWVEGVDSLEEKTTSKDSIPYFNINGKYLIGLAKFKSSDSLIWDYVEAKYLAGDISPAVLINVFSKFELKDFEDPFMKKIVVVEIYLKLIQADVSKKKQQIG